MILLELVLQKSKTKPEENSVIIHTLMVRMGMKLTWFLNRWAQNNPEWFTQH